MAALRLMRVMRSTGTKLMALAAEAAIALGLFLREFVIIQYSVTAGICMAGAVFLFLTAPEEEKPSKFIRRNLVPLMLVVLSFMIRIEVCIMLMPFLLLAGISQWFGSKKIFTRSNIKKYITLIGTALLLMLIVYSLDLLAYRNSEWVRFQNFFDARTKLYDFMGCRVMITTVNCMNPLDCQENPIRFLKITILRLMGLLIPGGLKRLWIIRSKNFPIPLDLSAKTVSDKPCGATRIS